MFDNSKQKHLFESTLIDLDQLVNKAGGLPAISQENLAKNKPSFRHMAQPKPHPEMMEFIVEKPKKRRFKATKKDLLLETEETLLKKYGDKVFN